MLKIRNFIKNKNFPQSVSRLLVNKQKFRYYSSASSVDSNPEISSETNNLETKLQTLISDEIRQNKVVPIFKKSLLYNHSTAIKDNNGEFSYSQVYMAARKLSIQISNLCGKLIITIK